MSTSIWTTPIGGAPFTDAERRQIAVVSAGVWRGLAKWSLLVAAAWLLVHLAACHSTTAPSQQQCYNNYWSSTNGGPPTCVIVPVSCPAPPPVCP